MAIPTRTIDVAIIGAGPAGLMAAETLIAAGHK
ncbi:MAG: FAD-dependent monooxygenase, partial [Kordiimonadaceae bacterium]|nr:FAD-dependent monooxygenase [Kordiimonadaceae bacterium]